TRTVKVAEGDPLFIRRRVHAHRNVHQPETDRSLPNRVQPDHLLFLRMILPREESLVKSVSDQFPPARPGFFRMPVDDVTNALVKEGIFPTGVDIAGRLVVGARPRPIPLFQQYSPP